MSDKRSVEEVASFKGMGLAIIELRESRGLRKVGLASKAGVGASTLHQIELGEVDAKWGTLRKLASALQVPLDALIERALELAPGVGREARRETLDHSA
jgi:transcriptional regulator with XRE-family HTH domain